MYLFTHLQIAELSKLLSTIVKLTAERLYLLVDNLMSTNIAALSKSLAANFAAVWPFSSVSPFVCLDELDDSII